MRSRVRSAVSHISPVARCRGRAASPSTSSTVCRLSRETPSVAAALMDSSAVRTTSSQVAGSIRSPCRYPVIDVNLAPVAASASRSLSCQLQISTAKPMSWIRRTRSMIGNSVKTISEDTASSKVAHDITELRTTGCPVSTDSRAASATSSATRASAPLTEVSLPVRYAVDEMGELCGVGVGEQFGVHSAGILGRIACQQHPIGSEDLAADVVAVDRLEARLRDGESTVVEPDLDDRCVQEAVVRKLRDAPERRPERRPE